MMAVWDRHSKQVRQASTTSPFHHPYSPSPPPYPPNSQFFRSPSNIGFQGFPSPILNGTDLPCLHKQCWVSGPPMTYTQWSCLAFCLQPNRALASSGKLATCACTQHMGDNMRCRVWQDTVWLTTAYQLPFMARLGLDKLPAAYTCTARCTCSFDYLGTGQWSTTLADTKHAF